MGRLRVVTGRIDDDLAITHRDLFAWIMVHAHVMALPVQHIHDLIAIRLLVGVIDGHAAPLSSGLGVSLLNLLLDLVSRITASRSACQAGEDTRVAATDSATEQPAYDRTHTCTDEPVFVFGLSGMGNLLIMALLTRSFDRLGERLGADDFRSARRCYYPIPGDRTNGGRGTRANHQTDCQRLVHFTLLRWSSRTSAR